MDGEWKWQREASRTVAASFHLPHLVEGIRDQVRESPVQVHRGQAALVPVPGCDQFGQIAVHALRHATDVQLSCKTHTKKAVRDGNKQKWYTGNVWFY